MVVLQKNTITTLITVLKYELYQTGDTADDTADGTTERRIKEYIKKDNKDKKDNKYITSLLRGK